MNRRPPRSTRTYTLLPYTTRLRSEQREQGPQGDAGADRHRGERGPADGVACGPAQGARDEVAEQVGKQADRERQRARLQCPQPAGVQRKVHSPGTTLRAAASRLPSATRRTAAAKIGRAHV